MDKICPRCGEKYSYIGRLKVKGNVYCYAVHDKRLKGNRSVRRCYLGPEEYRYVSKMHDREGLRLKGFTDKDRALEYLYSLLEYIVRNPPENAFEVACRLRDVASMLEHVKPPLK